MALTTVQSIDAEIRQLEAQKKLVEKRDTEVPKAMGVLKRYAKVLSPAQRRQVAKIIGDATDDAPRAARKPRAAKKARVLGKVPPKYRLPTGETWTGRGLAPKAFAAWTKSANGKAWTKAHPEAKYPPAGRAPAKALTPKASKKATRKTVKRSGKRTAKKAAKKA